MKPYVIGPLRSGQYAVTDDGVRFFSVHPSTGTLPDRQALCLAVRHCAALAKSATVEVYEAAGFRERSPRRLVATVDCPFAWALPVAEQFRVSDELAAGLLVRRASS